jgi:hypothetical protein
MKNHLLFISLISLILYISCSKDQKVVRQLAGDWKVTNYTIDGAAQDKSAWDGQVYSFNKCKVKKEWCTGTVTVPDSTKGTITMEFKYKIREKGKKFDLQVNFLGIVSDTQTSDIKEHSKSKFVYSYTDSGKVHEITMTKK